VIVLIYKLYQKYYCEDLCDNSMIKSETLDPYETVLAFLYAGRNVGLNKIHIQKGVFIASKYIKKPINYLETNLWEDAIDKVVRQLISNKDLSGGRVLRLTKKGLTRAISVWDKLDDNEKIILTKIADFISKMSVDELLLYTYIMYGDHMKPVVLKRILRKRRSLAMSIYLKGLISLGLAAELAGISLLEFINYMKKKHVKPYIAEEKDLKEIERL